MDIKLILIFAAVVAAIGIYLVIREKTFSVPGS